MNSGVVRLSVASHETALAPFSQNSNDEVCFGSGQAQPRQSNPCGWFILRRPRVSFTIASDQERHLQQLSGYPTRRHTFVLSDTLNIVFAHYALDGRGNISPRDDSIEQLR